MTFYELTTLVPMWFLRLAAFGFGCLWGSFLNVVIYRVPLGMSVVKPASHCPGCGKPVAPYDNIPIVSFLVLRGRARCCGVRMSPRYLFVELIGGGASLAVFHAFLGNLGPQVSLVHASAIYFAYFALCLGLVAAAFIDIEHMYLPDAIMLGGIVVGIATATVRGLPTMESVLGAACGFTGVWFPFTFLYRGLRGWTGMGVGDAKLVALAGAWCGWPGAVFVLFAGAMQGSVYAIIAKTFGLSQQLPEAVRNDLEALEKEAAAGDVEAKEALAEDPLVESYDPFILNWIRRRMGKPPLEDPNLVADDDDDDASDDDANAAPAQMRIPFGPFLILGIFEVVFFGDWITRQVRFLGFD